MQVEIDRFKNTVKEIENLVNNAGEFRCENIQEAETRLMNLRRREYERRRREYERIEFRNKVIKYTTGAVIVVGCVALSILYRKNMMAYCQRAM